MGSFQLLQLLHFYFLQVLVFTLSVIKAKKKTKTLLSSRKRVKENTSKYIQNYSRSISDQSRVTQLRDLLVTGNNDKQQKTSMIKF